MNVVEIGCGEDPGPFFEGADRHYLVEQDLDYLAVAESKGTYTALLESDATRIELPSGSVDTVLARNVFGDPHMRIRASFRGLESSLAIALIEHGGIASFQALEESIENLTYDRKMRFVKEASRVLNENGKLIVVEQKTPHIAGRFFAKLSQDEDADHGLQIEQVPISSITPNNYATVHDHGSRSIAWLGTKQLNSV